MCEVGQRMTHTTILFSNKVGGQSGKDLKNHLEITMGAWGENAGADVAGR